MDNAVPLHEAAVARPRPEPLSRPGWSAFFQSLGQSEPDHTPRIGATPVARFATSA